MTARRAVFAFLPYCPDSIGEQVVQIPFLHALREAHPGAEIVAVTPERSGGVIEALGLADRMVPHPVHAGPAVLGRVTRALRGAPCERVYLLRRKSLRTVLLARMATSAPITGFAHGPSAIVQARTVPFDHGAYLAENYLRLLDRHLDELAGSAPREPDDRVVIVPGGRTAIKRYPIERYAEVARALGSDRPVHVLLGPGTDAEQAALADTPCRVHVGRPITEVREILRKAALVIANDCGPAHFAHIEDIPRISLFSGAIDAAHWFHPGRNGRLIQVPKDRSLATVAPDEVIALAQTLLAPGTSPVPPARGEG